MKNSKVFFVYLFLSLIFILLFLFVVHKSNTILIIESTNYLQLNLSEEDIEPYLNFIKLNSQYIKPTNISLFLEELTAVNEYLDNHPNGKNSSSLPSLIKEKLNIGFLLDKIQNLKLQVITISETKYDTYTEKIILFNNSETGLFQASLLIPTEYKKTYPAIIGLHGHEGDSITFKENYFVEELVNSGFVVILPNQRAFDCQTDTLVTHILLQNGFSLMGLRVYEVLLILEYLKYLDFVNDNIGIIAHSGGSSVSILTIWLTSDVKALVYDMDLPLYDPLSGNSFDNSNCGGEPHCETIPFLAYYNKQINNLNSLNVISQQFDYGFNDAQDKENAINFFIETLK